MKHNNIKVISVSNVEDDGNFNIVIEISLKLNYFTIKDKILRYIDEKNLSATNLLYLIKISKKWIIEN